MTGYYMVPTAADKPHIGVTMHEPIVAQEGEMLQSELLSALCVLLFQVRSGRSSSHHTKPVLVLTFQWETHARLTQAHMNPRTNKIIIRQSRQLDLRGKQPPPDARLLLRWMLNAPVGEMQYDDSDAAAYHDEDEPRSDIREVNGWGVSCKEKKMQQEAAAAAPLRAVDRGSTVVGGEGGAASKEVEVKSG